MNLTAGLLTPGALVLLQGITGHYMAAIWPGHPAEPAHSIPHDPKICRITRTLVTS